MQRTRMLSGVAIAAIGLAGCSESPTVTPSATAPSAVIVPLGGCSFEEADGTVLVLQSSCTTTTSIVIPDGYALDGAGLTITAADPAGDHFRGGVIESGGSVAHVRNLTISAAGLANACDAGDDRLRGILFEGAAGSIERVVVDGLNQGASGCQEGNAIEVRNIGHAPGRPQVAIKHNVVRDYQKTGIVANGDVDVEIMKNTVGASATQANLAANSIQIGFGASGRVALNEIEGNQWLGTSNYAATAILLYDSGAGLAVMGNEVAGNSDVGLYVFANGVRVWNNQITDVGPDAGHYDIGIGNWGSGNEFWNNTVSGFDTPTDGVEATAGTAGRGRRNGDLRPSLGARTRTLAPHSHPID